MADVAVIDCVVVVVAAVITGVVYDPGRFREPFFSLLHVPSMYSDIFFIIVTLLQIKTFFILFFFFLCILIVILPFTKNIDKYVSRSSETFAIAIHYWRELNRLVYISTFHTTPQKIFPSLWALIPISFLVEVS